MKTVKEPHAYEVELTVKPNWRGQLVIYRRDAIPDESPSMFTWGRWEPADITDLAFCIKRLTMEKQNEYWD